MKEETIKQRAERGEKVFEDIRTLQRASRLQGNRPAYLILPPDKVEDLIDYLMNKGGLNPITDSSTCKILGLEIITDENQILKLK